MAKAGSSKKAVYVTHKKQTLAQRLINRVTGVREANRRQQANRRREIRNVFRRKSNGGMGG